MNVLQLSNADNGGATWWLKQALEKYTDYKCRAVRMIQNYLDYPFDILAPSPERLAALWRWADVIHVRDGLPNALPPGLPRKPTVITFHGNFYRRNHLKYHEWFGARKKWVISVSTVDLTAYHPTETPAWLPQPREDMADLWKPDGGTFTVVHAPTIPEDKGTDTVTRAVRAMKAVRLELIQKVSYAECVERKARGHLLVDQFTFGYGNNAIEAWAMGMPSVGGYEAERYRQAILNHCGYVPVLLANESVASIKLAVARLQDDPTLYRQYRERGRQYFFENHHAPVVAQKAVALYERAKAVFNE